MIVKTYSILNDTLNGAINLTRLHSEIATSGSVVNFTGISTDEDTLNILGDSIANQLALDSVINSHEDVILSEYKQVRYNEIDYKTSLLLSNGFTFDNVLFSLSINAQINWNALYINQADFTWPVGISTKDNSEYVLALADVGAFWLLAKNTIQGHLDSGRNLKKQIYAAVDKIAVDAIVDNR